MSFTSKFMNFFGLKSRTNAPGTVSGSVLVGSNAFTAQSVTVATITDMLTNAYYVKAKENQRNLIFADCVQVDVVLDGTEEVDEEVTRIVREMCNEPGNDLDTKMQVAWSNCFDYGAAPVNFVWRQDGAEFRLEQIRVLDPVGFDILPPTLDPMKTVPGDILKGIVYNRETDEIEFWQRPGAMDFLPVKLENVTLIKDPTITAVAGRPVSLPIIYIIQMLRYAWDKQMQLVNRCGSPPLFARVTNIVKRAIGIKSDAEYLQEVLSNWGSDTAFQLRENMEFVDPFIRESVSAIETIRELVGTLERFFSPSNLIAKDGTLIGGSTTGELELMQTYIDGIHRWIEKAFETQLQKYLDANGFTEYRVRLTIPNVSLDRTDLDIQVVRAGYDTRTMTLDERREKLKLIPATDEVREELEKEFSQPNPLEGFSGFPSGPSKDLELTAGGDQDQGEDQEPGGEDEEETRGVFAGKDSGLTAEDSLVRNVLEQRLNADLARASAEAYAAIMLALTAEGSTSEGP